MTCQIYLISPPVIEANAFASMLDQALSTKKVAAFQLRLKDIPDEDILHACSILMPISHRYGVPFILNDRADLAHQAGADGVHVGEEDYACRKARTLIGPNKTIGVSCYNSIDRAMEAGEHGADYVSFGAFYPTTTKVPKATATIDLLSKWTEMSTLPCTAIGGITDNNCHALAKAGADFIAVISYVWNHPEGVVPALTALQRNID